MDNQMKTLLITGFEPFGAQDVNPSWECLCDIPESVNGVRVVKARLPVEWDRINAGLDALFCRHAPDAAILFGQAGGVNAVLVERIAMNLRDAKSPDNAGKVCINEPVVSGGPDGIFATLPVYAMLDALVKAGIPASFSYTPGPYLCNNAMYYALHYAATKKPAMRAGFVHVPYMSGQSETAFTMELGEIKRAAGIIVNTVASCLTQN